MRKTLVPSVIGIVVTLIFAVFACIRFVPLERLEFLLYDIRYNNIKGKEIPPKEIVIVAIDDRSLKKIGRWPWDRGRIAHIIDSLREMGAKVIVVDIAFSEPANDDDTLSASIRHAGNVVLPIVFDFKGKQGALTEDMLYDNAFPMVRDADLFEVYPPISAKSVQLPIKKIASASKAVGHINMIPDNDGSLRHEIMAIRYDKEMLPSIDLQAARIFMGLPIEAMTLKATEGIQLGDTFIPTDIWGRSLIYYYGPAETFPSISALDVIEKKVAPEQIRDRIVLIGSTALGVYDLRVTPMSIMPGVEKHANVIASILRQNFVRKITNLTNILIVLVSGIAFSLLIVRLKALPGAMLTCVFVGALYLITYYFFFRKLVWIDLSYSGVGILIAYLAVTSYRYATEERYAKRIRGMFSSYVTERVVNELIKNPNLAKLGGERREITVLFSDVRGFTTFSEQHAPEQVVAILNEYLGEMTDIVFQWEGTLDKFVGDEIIAFWGAPLPQENHAELAVRCMLHMAKRLNELQEKWKSEGKTPFYAGFGINTGEVIVGNIGAEGKKMDYTIIGDNVNLGARVEGLTRKYDTDMIITEATLNKIRRLIAEGAMPHVRIEGLDRVAVKGKTEPVTIYSVSSLREKDTSCVVECEKKEAVFFSDK